MKKLEASDAPVGVRGFLFSERDVGSTEPDIGPSEADIGLVEPDIGSSEADIGPGDVDIGSSEADIDKSMSTSVYRDRNPVLRGFRLFRSGLVSSRSVYLRRHHRDLFGGQDVEPVKDGVELGFPRVDGLFKRQQFGVEADDAIAKGDVGRRAQVEEEFLQPPGESGEQSLLTRRPCRKV